MLSIHRSEQACQTAEAYIFEHALATSNRALIEQLRPQVRAMVDTIPIIKAREHIHDLRHLSVDGDCRTKYADAIAWLESLAEILGISPEDEGYVGVHLALRTQVHD